MSVAAPRIRTEARDRAAAWLLAAGGVALLLLRTVVGSPAILFVAVAAAAAAPAVARDRSRLPLSFVLAVGVVGVLVARSAAGPPLPLGGGVAASGAVVVAAVAEEALFRRLCYGLLLRRGVGIAILGSALAFALVHVPLYGIEALPVDLGAGLVLGWQRWASGGWAAPAATHAFANLLAVLA